MMAVENVKEDSEGFREHYLMDRLCDQLANPSSPDELAIVYGLLHLQRTEDYVHALKTGKPLTQQIPKIIHQIWVGPKEISDDLKTYMLTWQKLHQGWEYRLWQDGDDEGTVKCLTDNGETLIHKILNFDSYHSTDIWAQKADILRYELLYCYGGLMIDCDFECLQPIDRLLQGSEYIPLGQQIPRQQYVDAFIAYEAPNAINNAILGSVPCHPFFKMLVLALPASMEDHKHEVGIDRVEMQTAGKFVHRMWLEYYECSSIMVSEIENMLPSPINLHEYGIDLVDFPTLALYPYPRNSHPPAVYAPETFAVHHWKFSWAENV
jgi:mannosyltransferase OCH1-like enzyme